MWANFFINIIKETGATKNSTYQKILHKITKKLNDFHNAQYAVFTYNAGKYAVNYDMHTVLVNWMPTSVSLIMYTLEQQPRCKYMTWC